MAFAVDARRAKRAAVENNFIAALYDEGPDEWGEENEHCRDCRQA